MAWEDYRMSYACKRLLLRSAPNCHVFLFHMFYYCIHIFKPFLSAVNTVGNIIGTQLWHLHLQSIISAIISSPQ